MTIDKNKAILEFLGTCPAISGSRLYFNFIDAGVNNKQIITLADDKATQVPYIDGTVDKTYSFTIIDFKSVSFNPVIQQTGYSDENVDDMFDVQAIIDWIHTQNTLRNFPDFGDDCIINRIGATTENPTLSSIDTTLTPALARYSVTIQVDYLDTTDMLWKQGGTDGIIRDSES